VAYGRLIEAGGRVGDVGAVGFVGLGTIGAPMAEQLTRWPHGLVVCDVRREACEPLADKGARVAGSAASLAAECDVVSVMVLDDAQVRSVVAELAPHLRPGSVVAIHSTIAEQTAIEVSDELRPRDVGVLDAPVTGGWLAAAEGRLATMVGGDLEAFERARPVFECWAELVMHVGPVGLGTRAKAARALLTFVGYAAAAESQRLAEAAGIDLRTLAAVVRQSDGITGGPAAVMVRETTAPLADDDPIRPIFEHMVRLGTKDLGLALDLGVDLPFARLAADRLASDIGVAS
jgi:3-hydroxyisobutyrate dehydrogenase-like beta-hydroxyacid dehydrogenase